MTTRTTLKAPNGTALAVMEDDGSKVHIKTMGGSCKGYYDKRSDRTYKMNGMFIGHGNLLVTLL